MSLSIWMLRKRQSESRSKGLIEMWKRQTRRWTERRKRRTLGSRVQHILFNGSTFEERLTYNLTCLLWPLDIQIRQTAMRRASFRHPGRRASSQQSEGRCCRGEGEWFRTSVSCATSNIRTQSSLNHRISEHSSTARSRKAKVIVAGKRR